MAPATTAPHREDPPATTSSEDSLFTDRERGFMRLALAEAEEAYEVGEIPVGCVLVRRGEVIGKGQNRTNETRNGTRHCEMEAIDGVLIGFSQNSEERQSREAMARFWDEVDLYVTCEPCIMCASALSQLGIAKCYFGCRNDKFGGCGSILSLHEGNFDIVEGLREAEAVDLFRRFYDRENSRTLGTEAHGDKRTRRRTARDSGVDGDAAGGDGAGGDDGAT